MSGTQTVPTIVNLALSRSLPTGTFGGAWADFLDQNGRSPLTTGFRHKQLHDGIHILTGYGSDSLAEAEVQAFLLGKNSTNPSGKGCGKPINEASDRVLIQTNGNQNCFGNYP
ncbi:MAG: ubiquinone biosynthesis protein COQ4 [Trichocoleus desertorum ATA4-8-CV12]|nr:ubiquinone biosynthesis protein COQ4 [Trichocoleus desertorum ATA4-8-CV12]